MTTNSSLNTSTNSAALVSSSTGVPTWSGTMTNGQVVIGSTGATPTAATLTPGTGISITNGAGAVTITNTGGVAPGSPWTQIQQITTAGSQSAVNFTSASLANYNQLLLYTAGGTFVNNLYISGSVNGGSTYTIGVYTATSITNPYGIASGTGAICSLIIDNPNLTMGRQFTVVTTVQGAGGGTTATLGMFVSSAQLNAFQLTPFSGTFPNGIVFTFYGR